MTSDVNLLILFTNQIYRYLRVQTGWQKVIMGPEKPSPSPLTNRKQKGKDKDFRRERTENKSRKK